MKRTPLLLITAMLVLVGCGIDAPEPTPTSTASPSPTATPTPESLTLSPGRFGPVEVGMSKDEAAATGLFDVDVEQSGEGCPVTVPLAWKPPYTGKIDVLTGEDGTVVTMGVLRDTTIETDTGIHVGSTLGDVREAYGDDVSPAKKAGFDQSGVWVNEGDDWLGFLFDDPIADVSPSSTVSFMEVTRGERPELIRSGC